MKVIKCFLGVCLLVLALPVFSQYRSGNYHEIDWKVQNVNAMSPDSLAYKLSSPFITEHEKVRAIFSWITRNIAYNTGIFRPTHRVRNIDDVLPDSVEWKTAYEMTAYQVLRRRIAVCEGYAKLFATLCNYAGIKSEVITGYASCGQGRSSFRTNHSWNAVRIDSAWHLLDVTWGSGYIDQNDEFVQHTDDSYFLVPPAKFIYDHFPDDLRWSLLDDIPKIAEFRRSPFQQKSFVKYTIGWLSHSKGIIEGDEGDTIRIELEIKDRNRDKKISPDPFFDSAILVSSPRSVFIDPVYYRNKAVYTFILPSAGVDWLHLIYNEDIVLRYRLVSRPSPVAIRKIQSD